METPTFLNSTRGWNAPGLSFGEGMYVEDVDMPERWHVCGNCRQPITNRGREDCKNNKEVR